MLKCLLTLPLIILVGLFSLLQKPLWAQEETDTTKAHSLIQLSKKYWYIFPDSSIFLAEEAIKLIDTTKHKKLLSHAYSSFGNAFYLKGNHAKSLDYYFRALHLDEELQDSSCVASTLNNIGNIYMVQAKFDEAFKFFSLALVIKYQLNDPEGIGRTVLSVANLYSLNGKYKDALEQARKALAIFDSLNDREGLVTVYTTLGSISNNFNEPEEALEYFESALTISKESKDYQNECIISLNIGNVYFNLGNIDKAIVYYENALMHAQEIDFLQGLSNAFEKLSLAYEMLNETEVAFQYYKLFIGMSNSLERKENIEALVRNSLEYKFEKEQERAILEQEKKDIIVKEKEKRQNLIIIAVFILLCGTMVIIFLVYRSYCEKNKANLLLETKNNLINQQHKDITDSINYAKRIQTAKLPKKEEIYKALPQSFILFKPKDIVSGDFYFFEKNHKSLFIAAADCTGHGVPGAFMSLICLEKLTVALQETSNPSEILSLLNKGIKASLHQTEDRESTKDGMDIALCSIDIENGVVNYAGAYNPLWIIRNGKTEIEEIKATRKSIGGFTKDDQHFEGHIIQLQKNDTFYIFSDGYADQDGGSKGKKLMRKKFKQMLLSIQNKTMLEQEKYLEEFTDAWRGDREQLDDILIIGIRL